MVRIINRQAKITILSIYFNREAKANLLSKKFNRQTDRQTYLVEEAPSRSLKTEKKKKKEERLNDGNNNGQATHGARKHAWHTQAASTRPRKQPVLVRHTCTKT